MDELSKIDGLRTNFRRIAAAKELYDQLQEEFTSDAISDIERGRVLVRMKYTKETILRLCLNNKKSLKILADKHLVRR